MKHQQSEQTLVTLANASELVRNIVQAVVGNDVSSSVNGTPLSAGILHGMAQTRFNEALSNKIGN